MLKFGVMKYSLIFIICIFHTNAQNTHSSIGNKIKSTEVYNYNKEPNKKEPELTFLSGKFLDNYDETGRRTESIYYDAKGKITQRTVFGYDSLGHLSWENQYFSTGRIKYRYVYINDKSGKVLEEHMYKSNGTLDRKWVRTYDEKGNNIEEDVYNMILGSEPIKRVYKYDNNGNRTEGMTYPPYKGFVPSNKFTNSYDDKNQMIEETSYGPNNSITVFYFEYDNHGNRVQIIQNGISIKYSSSQCDTYLYKYDEKGNWIEKIQYTDDKPNSKQVRKIEYY